MAVTGGGARGRARGEAIGEATCRGRMRGAPGRLGAGVHMQRNGRAKAVVDEIPRNLRQVLHRDANLRQVLRDALHIGQERTASESGPRPGARAVSKSK